MDKYIELKGAGHSMHFINIRHITQIETSINNRSFIYLACGSQIEVDVEYNKLVDFVKSRLNEKE